MQGTILEFNTATNQGIISSADSGRYSFTIHQWKSSNTKPKTGMSVDFIVSNNIATEIYSIDTPSCANIVSDVSEKSVPIIKTIFKWAVIGGVLFFIIVGINTGIDKYQQNKQIEIEEQIKKEAQEKVTNIVNTMMKDANLLLQKQQYDSALKIYNGALKFYEDNKYPNFPQLTIEEARQFVFNHAYAHYKKGNYNECVKNLGADSYTFPLEMVLNIPITDNHSDRVILNSVDLYNLRATCLKYAKPLDIKINGISFPQSFKSTVDEDTDAACSLGDCDTKIPLEQKVENYYHKLNP